MNRRFDSFVGQFDSFVLTFRTVVATVNKTDSYELHWVYDEAANCVKMQDAKPRV